MSKKDKVQSVTWYYATISIYALQWVCQNVSPKMSSFWWNNQQMLNTNNE